MSLALSCRAVLIIYCKLQEEKIGISFKLFLVEIKFKLALCLLPHSRNMAYHGYGAPLICTVQVSLWCDRTTACTSMNLCKFSQFYLQVNHVPWLTPSLILSTDP